MKLDKLAVIMLVWSAFAWVAYFHATGHNRYIWMTGAGMSTVFAIGRVWRLNKNDDRGDGANKGDHGE